jgi:hypothetical protein
MIKPTMGRATNSATKIWTSVSMGVLPALRPVTLHLDDGAFADDCLLHTLANEHRDAYYRSSDPFFRFTSETSAHVFARQGHGLD